MEDPVRWGFLGAGSIARDALAPAVRAADGAVLHAVAARDPERARGLEPVAAYGDYAAVLDDPAVEVVYVALHNSAHAGWVVAAVQAGKHVLCEKPLGLSVAEVDRMSSAATNAGRLLVEAAWNRWHPRTREFERLLEAGAVGPVRSVESRFVGMPPRDGDYRYDPALGGGALYDVGCYAVAGALSAFGWQEPEGVEAEAETWPGGVDARTRARLTFPGGGTADVVGGLDGPYEERLDASGDGATLRLVDDPFTARDAPSTLELHDRADPSSPRVRTWPATNPYRLMVEEVSSGVRGALATVVPVAQSRAVARALDRIREAVDAR